MNNIIDKSKLQLAAAIILPNIGGFFGGRITRANIQTWYNKINKPKWNPPDYVFAPVWISLYSSIGYASYLIYRNGNMISSDKVQLALLLYGNQLILNWAWTPIFFKYHSLKWSFIELSALTVSAVACGWSFYSINQLAGWIFVPYVAWLGFATFLNYTIFKLNQNDKSIKNDEKITKFKDN